MDIRVLMASKSSIFSCSFPIPQSYPNLYIIFPKKRLFAVEEFFLLTGFEWVTPLDK
jgi:hypothetical protein